MNNKNPISEEFWGIHETHCCLKHGCKYGDKYCPVATGLLKQKYDCQAGFDLDENCETSNLKVFISKHSAVDKSFMVEILNTVLNVDYDDVDQNTVDATVETMKEILEQNWSEKLFKKKVIEVAKKRWEKNEFNLQQDWESLDDYLKIYKK